MFGARQKGSANGLLAALFALALVLRIAIPAGFMPTQTTHGIVVSVCDGMDSGRTMVIDLGIPADGKHSPEHKKQAAPCAFAGFSAPAIAADLALLVVRPGFVWGEFVLPPLSSFDLSEADFLTPPLRGPPALA